MTNYNDEIDFRQLMVIIFDFVKRNKKVLAAIIFISLVIGIIKYFTTKTYYTNNLIVTTNLCFEKSQNIFSKDIQPIYAVLSTIKDNAYNSSFIEKRLNINPQSLKNLNLQVLKDKNITSADPQNIIITISSYDKEIFPVLEKNIIDYCNNNEYLKKLLETQTQTQTQINTLVEKYTGLIDSISYSKKQANIPLIVDFSKFIDLQNLYSSQSSINSAIIVVQHFSKYPMAVSKKLANSIVYFIAVFLIGLIILIFKEIIRYAKAK